MSARRELPPARILLAVATTVIALAVLAIGALTGGEDEPDATAEAPEEQVTSTTATSTTSGPPVVDTSVVVAPDWYPKGSSTYSDRAPSVTITTLPPTSAPDDTDSTDSGTVGTGSTRSGIGGGGEG